MTLRALEPEDLEGLYEIENDMEIWSCGTTTAPISRFALRQYISTCKNDIFEDGQVRLAIDVDGVLAGLLDLTNFQPVHRRAEVGIVVRKQFQGKGIGREALCHLRTYATKIVGLHQIYAIVSENNVNAQKLFLSTQYTLVHKLKDWLISADGEMHDACLFQCFLD